MVINCGLKVLSKTRAGQDIVLECGLGKAALISDKQRSVAADNVMHKLTSDFRYCQIFCLFCTAEYSRGFVILCGFYFYHCMIEN